MAEDHHSLVTLRAQLAHEKDFHFSFAEDVDYHTRMLALKRKQRDEAAQNIIELEQAITELENKFPTEG